MNGNIKSFIILIMILNGINLVTAINIISPQDNIVVYSQPKDVLIKWEPELNNTLVLIKQQSQIIHNQTHNNSFNISLTQGSYYLQIIQGNQTINKTFNITLQKNLELELIIPDLSYEVGDSVSITLKSNKETTAQLIIKRDQEKIEEYTLQIVDELKLIYIIEEGGEYEFELQADETTITKTFEVEKIQPIELNIDYETPVINKAAEFTAEITGGKPPYDYTWVFSDDTTSKGETVTHYFFTPGTHSATLIITDSLGTQVSKQETFEVLDKTYKLTIELIDQDNNPLQGYQVIISQTQNNKTNITNQTGHAEFYGLKGTWNLEVKKENETKKTMVLDINENTFKTILLTIINQTNQTINNTDEIELTSIENNTNQTKELAEEIISTQQTIVNEELQQLELENYKLQAIDQVNKVLDDLIRDNKKYEITRQLGKELELQELKEKIRKATTKNEVDELLSQSIRNIAIQQELITEEKLDVDIIEEGLLEYLKKENKEEQLEDYISYLEKMPLDIIKKTQIITVEYPNQKQTYYYTSKQINVPEEASIIEYFPKKTQVEFNTQVNPITNKLIQVNDNKYQFISEDPVTSYTIVVPAELPETNLLTGLLTIKASSTNSIYILLIVAIIGLFVGKQLSTTNQIRNIFKDFSQLAEQAINLIHEGNNTLAAELYPEMKQLYELLDKTQKKELNDLMSQLEENYYKTNFLNYLSSIYEKVANSNGDLNVISKEYEEALTRYDQLPESLKQKLKDHINQLKQYLEDQVK